MFSSENREGRLVELRVVTPITIEEIVELQKTHVAVTQAVEGDYVVVVDFRHAHVFPPKIFEHFLAIMTQLNPRLQRSAILINHSAVLGLQAERAIQTAGHADRQAFRDPRALELWLSEVLSQSETARLRQFLLEGAALAGS